jgi:hypothetical protein
LYIKIKNNKIKIMKTYYKYKGKLVDVEKHFKGVCEICTDKFLVLLLNNYRGKKYIPLSKIVFKD